MKKIKTFLAVLCITIIGLAAQNPINLTGRVKTSVTNQDLINAFVLIYDSIGNVKDSIRTNQGLKWTGEAIDTMSYFHFSVPRKDSLIVFDVVCEGFEPQTVTYNLSNVKKREKYREIPTIFMKKAPVTLKEVTVTATKVKFYNKGDTLVYDATAFELAEGSMLDALISQLPGVELSNDGQIKVNGQFVESLLLDGKEFFDGNNNLMLENIAAYTVKNIEVYEGVTQRDKEIGKTQNKVLTMDVRLKKEYNVGWLVNLQGGYGTKNRYTGRAFLSWFNPKWRISGVGNINNLNDNRQPGRNDTWTPDMLPSGKKEFRDFGINYNFETPDEKTRAQGSLTYRQTINNVETNTNRINFLQGGDTYERSFSSSHDKQLSLTTNHSFFKRNDKVGGGLYVNGSYLNNKNDAASLAASFNEDPGEMTRKMLEAIYSDGSPEMLASLINRSATMTDGWNRTMSVSVLPNFNWKLPGSEDVLYVRGGYSYSNTKADLWKDYEINYGANPMFTEKLRQYTDNSPNRNFFWRGSVEYSTQIKNVYFSLDYTFQHSNQKKDSYMYALDHLNDRGMYGVLPSDYLLAFDPANSYRSHLWQNRHMLEPYIRYTKRFKNSVFNIYLDGTISLVHRKFAYWRDNKDYLKSVSNALISFPHMYNASMWYYFSKYGEGRDADYRNNIRYSYIIDPTLPDLYNMMDFVDDADPLNIYIGNPDLKPAIRQRHQIWWRYHPAKAKFLEEFSVSYTTTHNALVQGYTYDTFTGVRYNKMYNVNGNRTFAVSDNVSWQFGKNKQFTLSYTIDAGFSQETDMIGVDAEAPELTKIHSSTANQRFKFSWQLGKQNISLRCDWLNRHSTSSQPGFTTLNANHINAGVQGVFILPAGFGISTDFMCYTRRGYGVSYLDTTDAIWNLRVSYAPPKNKHWVFMLDGFDMLQQLSNVNYVVTASGRTISYTNVIPRYIMFSIQYRLNIQPKKR